MRRSAAICHATCMHTYLPTYTCTYPHCCSRHRYGRCCRCRWGRPTTIPLPPPPFSFGAGGCPLFGGCLWGVGGCGLGSNMMWDKMEWNGMMRCPSITRPGRRWLARSTATDTQRQRPVATASHPNQAINPSPNSQHPHASGAHQRPKSLVVAPACRLGSAPPNKAEAGARQEIQRGRIADSRVVGRVGIGGARAHPQSPRVGGMGSSVLGWVD